LGHSTVSIFTTLRYLAFKSFQERGRNNADLASTMAWDCSLILLAIFTLVLPAMRQMLKIVKPTGRADQSPDGEWTTVQSERYHPSSSALSSPASRPTTLVRPASPAASLAQYGLAQLEPARMCSASSQHIIQPHSQWNTCNISATTTTTSLCGTQCGSEEDMLYHAM
jgi:hypothetical protein